MLSIIMPALNEERNIAAAIGNTLMAFDDFGLEGEIIVVNDGSTDGTAGLVREAEKEDPRVSMIIHEHAQGIGSSFWDGFDKSKGEFICMLPGDNENDPWEIMRYARLLEHVDIVVPFVFNKEVRPLFRNALSLVYRFIVNTTFLVNFNYTNGTILYRKSILKELEYRSTGFFFQTDILIRSVKRGYLFAEVPYRLGVRNEGVSSAVTFPAFIQVIRGYLRLVRDLWHGRKGRIERRYSEDSLTARRHGGKENDGREVLSERKGRSMT